MKKLYIVRHAESEGNVDHRIYLERPDYAIRLTEKGAKQARNAGYKLNEKEGNFTFFVSNYHRTRQTLHNIKSSIDPLRFGLTHETPLLREQEWTNALGKENSWDGEKERVRLGVFNYRFIGGESCADVFARMKIFINFDLKKEVQRTTPNDIVIVSHGMAMRVLIMALLNLTVEEFEAIKNPKNCEIWEINCLDNGGFQLVTELRSRGEDEPPFEYDPNEFTKL